jgi:hypothetical protein
MDLSVLGLPPDSGWRNSKGAEKGNSFFAHLLQGCALLAEK